MILVISDYHRKEQEVLDLISKHKPSHILCCGDGESEIEFYTTNNITSVKGNCDYANLPLTKVIDIEGKKYVMVHGHNHDVYFDIFKLYLLAKSENAQYVLFGHTHQQYIEEYEGITFINPGALKEGNYILIDNNEIIKK